MKNLKRTLCLILAAAFVLPSSIILSRFTPSNNPAPPGDNVVVAPDNNENSSNGTSGTVGENNTNSSNGSNNSNNSNSSNNSNNQGNVTTPTVPPSTDATNTSTISYIKCTGDSVNIRSGAGADYAVLGSAKKNTRYAVIGKTGNWYKTYYKGKTAYLNASYAAVFRLEKSDNEKIERVLEEGYKLIGVPYVYGAVRLHDGNGNFLSGFTAQKFDCSSLVQYVFYKGAGKLLQTTTRTQILQGKRVKSGDLQRGDCMFFTNESRKHLSGIERVGHVAIYLGDNYILHTASDYARIEQISTTRWNHFLEARRFL